jgi:hypothetical protein
VAANQVKCAMDKKPLAYTNRHLVDAVTYQKDLLANVSSSTSIETGKRVAEISDYLAKDLADKKVIFCHPLSPK